MFPIWGSSARLCDSVSRRELLRVGGATAWGLSLPALLRARESANAGLLASNQSFGRAKNLIFLYLQGGPPQHETFDPKPRAPAEIRGPFKPIATNVPGIDFCELLPRTARIADKLAVVRSMSTDDNVHSSSGYWVLTGYKYVGPNARTIQSTDWPYFGSLVKMLKPSDRMPPLSTVWIPDIMRLNESVTPAGQTGGLLGAQWTPERFIGDPASANYQVRGLSLGDLPPLRFQNRIRLLAQVEEHFRRVNRSQPVRDYDVFQQQAFDLLTSSRAKQAFEIEREPDAVRERYTRSTWGQSCLLARRLIEAGVRMVHVNWPREPGDNAVDNPLWDTHAQNHDRVEDVLCPQFDVSFTALIDDLAERGLLDETLVVAIGEFGRTPKINAKAGRDHWGSVFSFVMAGAGISGGQVYGASDANGAYPARDRVQPGQLTATIFHLLGIDSQGFFHDKEGRERRLTAHEPLFQLLGTEPATLLRQPPGGDVSRVPTYDPKRLLTNTDFSKSDALAGVTGSSRPKRWRATPMLAQDADTGFGIRLRQQRVEMGFVGASVSQNVACLLAQEVRSPFAGTYRVRLRARGECAAAETFQREFLNEFQCRIEFFQFSHQDKSPANRKPLAIQDFVPVLSRDVWQTIEFTHTFENPRPGANFSFGLGLGVAIVVEQAAKTKQLQGSDRAVLVVDSVELEFIGKERNAKVQV